MLLLSPNDLEISRVTYADTWYNDAIKDDGGWSLEQLNPNDFCGGKFNWSASVDETGGTPGRKNSIYLNLALPFQVYSVNASDSLNLTVTFNKSLDTLTLQTSQFAVNNGIGNPQSLTILSQESIKLTFSAPLQKNILYTLSINTGIKNCAGVDLPLPSNNEFVLFNPQIFDILITEILADPSPQIGLPDLEFVELHNRTSLPVDLQGWTFSTGSTSKIIPEGIILPGSFIVLTAPEGINLFQGVSLAPISSFPSLTNSGSTLSIKDKNNNIIHSVTYSDSWYQETGKKDGGWSLEMIDPGNPCAGKENWHDSKDSHGGTPGLINSVNAANADTALPRPNHVGLMSDTLLVYFSEKINKNVWNKTKVNIDNGMGLPISTFLWEPDWDKVSIKLPSMPQAGIVYTITFSDSITDCAGNHVRNNVSLKFKLPETPVKGDAIINEVLNNTIGNGVEFTEIYNLSSKALDLKELRLCEADSSLGTLITVKEISPYSLLLMPGEYMLLSKDQSIVKSQYKTENADAFWDLVSMIDIANDGGTVALAKKTYDIIDMFSFDESFHFPLINVLDGVSLERIDPTRPTQDKTNWNSAAANVGYATPGYRNSQFLQAGTSNNEFSLEPEVFSPDNDGYQDVLNISYKLDSPGNMVSVTIYDEVGRQIRSLLSSQLLGTEGTFSWNGIADNNAKARMGVYVVYIELFDQKGKKKHFKLPVVVASKL